MKAEEPQASYFSIITADVRYDKSLSPLEKLLYAELTALAKKEGFAWASNNYFAKLYDRTPNYISEVINKLRKKGYITIEVNREDGNSRKIWIAVTKKPNTYTEKKGYPYTGKTEHNSIEVNSIVNRESNIANHEGSLFENESVVDNSQGKKEKNVADKKERKNTDTLFAPLKEIYLSWHKEKEETDYYFSAKDAGALSQLIKKLKFAVKPKEGQTETTEQQIKDAFKYFLGNLPKWFNDNDSSLTILNSKFNEIIKQIKSKTINVKPPVLTDEQAKYLTL